MKYMLNIPAYAKMLADGVLELNRAWNGCKPKDLISEKLDYCRQIAREIRGSQKYTAWIDIALAPKDGRNILGCVDHVNLYAPCMISWRTFHPNAEGIGFWRDAHGKKMNNVTHFMDLPGLPGQEQFPPSEHLPFDRVEWEEKS